MRIVFKPSAGTHPGWASQFLLILIFSKLNWKYLRHTLGTIDRVGAIAPCVREI
jgi:hypothetical protein